MFKRVDGPRTDVAGFSYENKSGFLEFVHKEDADGVCVVQDSNRCKAYVYKEDIPKLILALQAAYDHKE